MAVAMYGLVHDVETINQFYNGCCHGGLVHDVETINHF